MEKIKKEFFRILDKSTFQGLPNIFWTKALINKVLWIILSTASYVYCVWLVLINILEFNKFEVVTRYENIYESSPLFPYVMLCFHVVNRTRCEFNRKKCPDLKKATSPECELFNSNKNQSGHLIDPMRSIKYGSRSGLIIALYAMDLYKGNNYKLNVFCITMFFVLMSGQVKVISRDKVLVKQ